MAYIVAVFVTGTDFGPGGGFIFNPTHNVQAQIPVENLLAMHETLAECRDYPWHRRRARKRNGGRGGA